MYVSMTICNKFHTNLFGVRLELLVDGDDNVGGSDEVVEDALQPETDDARKTHHDPFSHHSGLAF